MNTIKHKFNFLVAHQTCTTPLEYILEILPKCTTNGPWIAGGALLRTYTGQPLDSDVDVFFQSQEQMTQFISKIALNAYAELDEDRNSSHYTIKDNVVSDWHTTITINYMQRDYKIQCVSFFYFKDVGELFDSFDFDVCMLAYDGESIHVSESTMDAINNKKVVLKKINYPSITLKRLVKYMRQGYDINDNDLMMLARSFRVRGFKEPKGILDEHFGITAFSKKPIGPRSDDYKALVTPL